MTMRTFIALELPDSHKTAIVEHLKVWRSSVPYGVNWVKPENLHLTLLFIGDTPAGEIPNLKQSLGEFFLRRRAFELKCMGFELFPASQPRLLWAKLTGVDNGIFELTKKLSFLIREHGLTPDIKPLKLHVTVGRIKVQQPVWQEEAFLTAALPEHLGRYDIITLYRSDLKSDGPIYTPIEKYFLR